MVDIIAYTVVIGLTGGLFAVMLFIVRAMTADAEQHRFFKDLVDVLFTEQRKPHAQDQEQAAARRIGLEPFTEACPACSALVTQDDVFCPSCELRLMD